MDAFAHHLIGQLDLLVISLRRNGGVLTPSVYDSAQALRHTPPADARPLIDWLLAQQQADGGWGDPRVPLARDVPTLATMLALLDYHDDANCVAAIQDGIRFFETHAQRWDILLPNDVPVAVELIMPTLLDQAAHCGLAIPHSPYLGLRVLGSMRRRLIEQFAPKAGTAPSHAWEGWGEQATSEMLDATHGVGHSPAATAFWIDRARRSGQVDQAHILKAEAFMQLAGQATLRAIPGLVPTVWPIDRFEQSWAMHAIFSMALQDLAPLAEQLRLQLHSLASALRPAGLGMSDHFIYDGDITSTTLALLASSGYQVDPQMIMGFARDEQFFTYMHEMQPSLTTTAHAVLALGILGQDVAPYVQFLVRSQAPDGRWGGDKWHSSWLYTTSQVLIALAAAQPCQALKQGLDALLLNQLPDGGWGINQCASSAETSYAVHALFTLASRKLYPALIEAPLERAYAWLSHHYSTLPVQPAYWIGKELYCPYRVDRAFELSALAGLLFHQDLWRQGAPYERTAG